MKVFAKIMNPVAFIKFYCYIANKQMKKQILSYSSKENVFYATIRN